MLALVFSCSFLFLRGPDLRPSRTLGGCDLATSRSGHGSLTGFNWNNFLPFNLRPAGSLRGRDTGASSGRHLAAGLAVVSVDTSKRLKGGIQSR